MIFNIFYILLLTCAFLCTIMISRADFRRRIIPDAYLFPLMILGLAVVVFFPWVCDIRASVVGAAFGYGLAALVGAAFDKIQRNRDASAPGPIGMGDIKLMAVGGIWLGATGLSIALIFACLFGGIWGLHKKQKYIPFAPFFLLGGILSLIIMYFLI